MSGGAKDSAEARARDQLEAAGAVAALLGHRARNRLASIRAALELLEAGLEANLSAEHRASLLAEMDALIGDFNLGLDLIRCTPGSPEPLSAREEAEAAIAVYSRGAPRAPLAVETRFAPEADSVRADRRLLRLILLNLLRNAAQAQAARPAPRARLTSAADGRFCRLELADDGPGVAAAVRDRLFL
jgi:signal transduction histidine kinase